MGKYIERFQETDCLICFNTFEWRSSMKKKWISLCLIVFMVMPFYGGGIVVNAEMVSGIHLTILDRNNEPIEGATANIMLSVPLVYLNEQWERSGEYTPYEGDGVLTNSDGYVHLDVPSSTSYIVQVSKDGYYITSQEIMLTSNNVERSINMVASSGEIEILDATSPSNLFSIIQLQDGSGINLGVIGAASQLNSIVDETHFSVVLARSDYNVDTDGLPYNMSYDLFPLNEAVERREALGSYQLLVFFYKSEFVIDHTETTLLGYSQMPITIEDNNQEPGPGPGPGGDSLFGELSFDFKDNQDQLIKTYTLEYENRQRSLVLEVEDDVTISSGKIVFPKEFVGFESESSESTTKAVISIRFVGHTQPLDEPVESDLEINPYFFTPEMININNFGGVLSYDENLECYTLTYTSPYKRINIDIEFEDSEPLTLTIYQPGYGSTDLIFEMEDRTVTETMGLSLDQPQVQIQVPEEYGSGDIVAKAVYTGTDNSVEMFFGGVWEYLADRSLFAKTDGTNVDGNDIITLSYERYFGKVTLHLQYVVGNAVADAMVSFYEADFVGLDVFSNHSSGDWYSGITNASNPDAYLPTGFIYFLNDQVYVKPSTMGRPFTITAVQIKQNDIYVPADATFIEDYPWHFGQVDLWDISLPDVTNEPVTDLLLSIHFTDTDLDAEVPLQVRRVLFTSSTMDYTEQHKQEILSGIEIVDYDYTGEDSITFVNVFAYYPMDQESPTFDINHKLLVLYYENDKILGSKQFDVVSNGNERNVIPVYRIGGTMDSEYLQFSAANRLAFFLIDGDGIMLNQSTFGGATFGIGAGWGHLLPNHPEYGQGKDGMLYE